VRKVNSVSGVFYSHNKGKLFDVGCGSGGFLAKMRNLGWEVMGVKADEKAVKVA